MKSNQLISSDEKHLIEKKIEKLTKKLVQYEIQSWQIHLQKELNQKKMNRLQKKELVFTKIVELVDQLHDLCNENEIILAQMDQLHKIEVKTFQSLKDNQHILSEIKLKHLNHIDGIQNVVQNGHILAKKISKIFERDLTEAKQLEKMLELRDEYSFYENILQRAISSTNNIEQQKQQIDELSMHLKQCRRALTKKRSHVTEYLICPSSVVLRPHRFNNLIVYN